LVGEFSGESPVDPNKTVLNELQDLRVAERAHGFWFMSRHEKILISLSQSRSPAKSRTGRLVRSRQMLPVVRPWAHSSSDRQRRRRQRRRKKTEAILRIRIIMVEQL
jgi:hypothetical protein